MRRGPVGITGFGMRMPFDCTTAPPGGASATGGTPGTSRAGSRSSGSMSWSIGSGAPAGTFAYAFQQLGNGKIVTAAWTHSNAQWPASGGLYSQTYSTSYSLQVDAAGASGNVTKIDGYGNVSTLPYTNGKVTLTLTEVPQYIVSSNATVAKANATVPVGYTGQ